MATRAAAAAAPNSFRTRNANQVQPQRLHPRARPRRRQRVLAVVGALGALVSHAPSGGAHRVPLPEHPNQELPLGRWRQDPLVSFALRLGQHNGHLDSRLSGLQFANALRSWNDTVNYHNKDKTT